MSKTMWKLAVITMIAVGGAVGLSVFDNMTHKSSTNGHERLLDIAPHEVRSVILNDGENRLEFYKDAMDWALKHPRGLKINAARLNRLILDIADLQIVEIKTDNPDLYERLNLGAGAKRIKLNEQELFLGKAAGGGAQRFYMRVHGDKRTYIVDGMPSISWALKDWSALKIPNIDKIRVRTTSILHPDLSGILIAAENVGGRFSLSDLGPGEEPAYDRVGDALGGAFNYLSYDAILPVSEVSFDDAIRTRFDTWDGLAVTVFIVKRDGVYWARFDVERSQDGDSGLGQLPLGSYDVDEELDSFLTLTKWAFQIPGYKLTEMVKRREEFLK